MKSILALLAENLEPTIEYMSQYYCGTNNYQKFNIEVQHRALLLKATPFGKCRLILIPPSLKSEIDAYNLMKKEAKQFIQETYNEILTTTP